MTPIEPTDSELLTSYVVDGSEAAVGQLVRRHIGLVYSAALRQLGGDSGAAEDVSQLVFTDLARKAAELRRHGSLAGWLHTSTRFLAAKVRRSDERRLLRETTALAMNPTDDDSAAWDEIRPVLDTALHELPDNDREAVLLRFFEKLSLGEVGSRLGVGEDAARKRVDRALDKLRGLLVARGVTSASAVVIASLLIDRASAAMPAQLTGQVTVTALKAATAATTGGALAWFLGWPAKLALAVVIAMLLALVATHSNHSAAPTVSDNTDAVPSVARPLVPTDNIAGGPSQVAGVEGSLQPRTDEAAGHLKLLLRLVRAGGDQPIAAGEIEVERWNAGVGEFLDYQSDSNGYCRIFYPISTTELKITTEIEGTAATRLRWVLANGQFLPLEHTLRLVAAVPVGGKVVDSSGNGIAGASVTIMFSEDPKRSADTESNEIGTHTTKTDPNGNWRIARLASNLMQRRFSLSVGHPSYPERTLFALDATAVEQLTNLSHQVVLDSGVNVRGVVVDASGEPVAGAKVYVGVPGFTYRETTTSDLGDFVLTQCETGERPITAIAEGLAGTTLRTDFALGMPPVRLVLARGRTVRLQALDPTGGPATNAEISLNPEPLRIYFRKKTGADGEMVWNQAPTSALRFNVAATGYMPAISRIGSNESTSVVRLIPKPTIWGEVRDAATGSLIPEFRLSIRRVTGESEDGEPLTSDPFSGHFVDDYVGGRFKKVFYGSGNFEETEGSRYLIQVQAKGYKPKQSRVFEVDEEQIHLDLKIELAPIIHPSQVSE
jgi:RNA polymerase sigma factor (sigma-70 family)